MYRFVKDNSSSVPNQRLFVQGTSDTATAAGRSMLGPPITTDLSSRKDIENLQAVYTKRRVSTEVLGSSLESTKTSRKGENGTRRITTRIVRKITTLTRGEEKSVTEDLVKKAQSKDVRVRHHETGDIHQKAIKPKRVKVCLRYY